MDDGVEGYMSPHTSRQVIPVCRRGNVCGAINSDQLFAINSAKISGAGRERLAQLLPANCRSQLQHHGPHRCACF